MRSISKQFDLWEVNANKIETVGSPTVTINDIIVNEIQLMKLKNIAHAAITMLGSDDIVDLVTENDDLADV